MKYSRVGMLRDELVCRLTRCLVGRSRGQEDEDGACFIETEW